MLTPEKISSLEQNEIIKMYARLNQDLTSIIIKKIEKQDLTSYTKAQIKALAKQGGKEVFYEALNKTTKLTSKQKKELKSLFNEIQKEEIKGYNIKISTSIINLSNTIYKRTYKTLKNLTKSIAYSSKEEYIKSVDELYKEVATGSKDYSSAMKSTINDLSQKGITLKDSAGRNVSLETAVKRNLMTGLTQTANDISKEIGDMIGANCVVIGHTPYCRPTHRVIDGVVMSLDKFKKYEYLTEEPNCYHIVNYDWREEFEGKENKTKDNGHLTASEYNKNYEIRQKQNYYASQVRNKKEQVSILSKSDKRNINTQEELNKAKNELKIAQMKYRQYSKSKGIDVDYSLTWKSGYNK